MGEAFAKIAVRILGIMKEIKMRKETLNNQGLSIQATYTRKELEEIFLPLLDKFSELRKEKGKRVLIYLAAPPGAGKTTLSLLLEKIYKQTQSAYTFQALPMDGFHHTNDYLMSHYTTKEGLKTPLKDFKGKPETFDLEGLKQAIQALQIEKEIEWRIYSRALHDVADETFTVDADILLLEGNYLLLDQKDWKDLAAYADYTIMLSGPIALLKKRIIERKLKGGHTSEDALAHYERADLPNHHLVMNQSIPADLNLFLNEKEEWVVK